jgi:HEPN domain-containing protein
MAIADATAAMVSCDPYSICFHCQQEVEKYFKAFLAFHGRTIPRVHDLEILLKDCIRLDATLSCLVESVAVFRPYAVEIRYRASKAIAEQDCPVIWGTSMAITKEIRKRLPDDLLEEASRQMP